MIMLLRLILLLSFILCTSITLPDIELNAESIPEYQEIVFSKLDEGEFLSNNPVYSICKDRYGYMWFGMRGGLYKYNGVDNSEFSNISNNVIRAVYEDSRGILWVGTEAGLNTFDQERETFSIYTHDPHNADSISGDIVWYIYEDSKGVVWIGTRTGLNAFDRVTETFTSYTHNPDDPTSISNNIIWSIYEDSQGTLWIGTNGGLNAFDRVKETFTSYTHNPDDPNSISSDIIRVIYEGSQGTIWIGTRGGVNYIDPDKQHFRYYDHYSIENNGIRVIRNYGDNILIGTVQGIIWFDYKDNTLEKYLSYYSIRTDIRNGITNCIWVDETGSIWVGTDYIGLLRIDGETGEYTIYSHQQGNAPNLPNGWIHSLFYHTEQNLLWIGTDKGLCSFDYQEEEFTAYYYDPQDPTSINSDNITILYGTEDGRLWIGTNKGLDRFNNETGEFIHYFQDSESEHPMIDYQVETIYEDSNGKLWIGTVGGLVSYNQITDDFRLYTEEDGLPGNDVIGVTEDNEGNIWIITNKSLAKLSLGSDTVYTYGVSHGLRGNMNYRNSIIKNDEGLVFVGTTNGLFSLDPSQIKVSTFKPPVVIENFSLINGRAISFDKPVEEIEEIVLPHADNSFRIDFIALDYTSQHDGKYAYMLEGFDTNWQFCGPDDSFARYTNINSGNYTFRVIASNKDNIWNLEGASLKITISPPFWQEWWFILLLIVVTILFVFSIVRLRTHSLHMRARELGEQVAERTSQLAEKTDQLSEELNRRIGFARALVHELKTPLTSLQVSNDLLVEETKEQPRLLELAYNISRSINSLEKRTNELLDISRGEIGILKLKKRRINMERFFRELDNELLLLAKDKGKNLECNIQSGLPNAVFDDERISQVIHNLIDNAFKYTTKSGKIKFSAITEDSSLIVSISDTGCGISMERQQLILNQNIIRKSPVYEVDQRFSGLGIGLVLSKMIIDLHGGQIWIDSELGKGSTFVFSIPIER